MISNLIPIAGNDSLRQVVASVYCHSNLIDPKRFENKIKDLSYQKFQIVNANSINIRILKNQMNNNVLSKENGFRMTGFDSDGRLRKILQVQEKQVDEKAITQFNFHSMKYPKWEKFRDEMIFDFKEIAKEDNPFIFAISLNYLNEFVWSSEDDISINEIFNDKADFMPNNFFKSQNSSYSISTEDYKEVYKSIEQLDVIVSKKNNKIHINSQLVIEFVKPIKFYNSIEDSSFQQYFESIHFGVKDTLRKLFTEEVKQKINLV